MKTFSTVKIVQHHYVTKGRMKMDSKPNPGTEVIFCDNG